jgi:hypothetical protein
VQKILKNELISIKEDIKIDFTNCKLFEYDNLGDFAVEFDISPLEYLAFAKENFLLKNKKGLIDAISNAKRAIDCQIDSIISVLGYDYKQFDNRKSYPLTKEFINDFYNGITSNGITEKIKLLNILNLMPTFLISKIRNLRNNVEHEYILPVFEEVQEALEIAELFIYSSNKKISDTNRLIYLGSNYKTELATRMDGSKYSLTSILPKFLCIEFSYHNYEKILLVVVNDKGGFIPYNSNIKGNDKYVIGTEMESYPYILKVLFDKDYSLIPKIIGTDIKKEFIKFSVENA